jgi:hypothetical protein
MPIVRCWHKPFFLILKIDLINVGKTRLFQHPKRPVYALPWNPPSNAIHACIQYHHAVCYRLQCNSPLIRLVHLATVVSCVASCGILSGISLKRAIIVV